MPNGWWYMTPEPVSAVPGWDDDPAWSRPDPITAADREAWLDWLCEQDDDPFDAPGEYWDPEASAPPPGADELLEDELAGIREAAGHLDARLPGTRAALRDGVLSLGKARLIATATGLLDEAEARAAEQEVLDRAGRLTPGGLRAAIARAVIEVAPGKAKKPRETAAKFARVERWAEDSGNAALAGRELSPDQVLAADERITGWARELKGTGLDGGMDELRARALLDLLLGQDSRPRPAGSPQTAGSQPGTPGQPSPAPAGFASRVTLTAPLATLTRLADRPGELSGLGPVDPWLTRDLAAARRSQPQDDLVRDRDRDRRPGARRRPRLRPPRTQDPTATCRPRPARLHFHARQPGRPARRLRHLAAAHPRTRTGPDHHDRPGHHRPL